MFEDNKGLFETVLYTVCENSSGIIIITLRDLFYPNQDVPKTCCCTSETTRLSPAESSSSSHAQSSLVQKMCWWKGALTCGKTRLPNLGFGSSWGLGTCVETMPVSLTSKLIVASCKSEPASMQPSFFCCRKRVYQN